MRNDDMAQREIAALQQEARAVMQAAHLSQDERVARAALIQREIIYRGGEPLEGVPLRANSPAAAQRSTPEAPKATRKKAAVKKKGKGRG